MQVQNPETEDKTEVNTEKTEETDRALDTARQLAKGEITFEEIEDEELLKEVHQRFAVEEEDIPEVGEEKPAEESSTEEQAPAEPQAEPQGQAEPEADPVEESNQTYPALRKAELDELNTIQQKIEAKRKRLEELDKLGELPQSRKHEDILSEESMEETRARLERIEKNQSEFFTGKKKELQKETIDLQRDKLYLELANFQLQNVGLKTSKPVNVLNAQYKTFVDKIGGIENVDKFINNKQFREQKEAEGHAFPMSDADYKNFDAISKINAFKNQKKYPTFSAAFHDYQRENGIVLDQVKNAAIEAAQKTIEGVGGQGGATTLSPDVGSVGDGKVGMSDKDMETWLINHPNPTSKADIAKAEEIHNLLMGRAR